MLSYISKKSFSFLQFLNDDTYYNKENLDGIHDPEYCLQTKNLNLHIRTKLCDDMLPTYSDKELFI